MTDVTDKPKRRPSTRRSGVVTIQDVAARAGVSAMTVSNVMNGTKHTQPTTRDAVLEAIAALRYVPNRAARSLATATDLRVGLLYADPENAFLSALLVGTLHAVTRLGAQLTIHPFSYGSSPLAEVRRVAGGAVDGLLIPAPLCEMVDSDTLATELPIPAVGLGAGQRLLHLAGIRIDNGAAMETATNHLLGLGHRRIGYIDGPAQHAASRTRRAGFIRAMEAAGIAVDIDLIAPGAFSYESGLIAAEHLLTQTRPPTAIMASTDDMAAAVIAIAHRIGLEVPRDLSVCGFNDSPIALRTWPLLTTIRQPSVTMAEAATETLVTAIRAKRAHQFSTPSDDVSVFELVVRNSTSKVSSETVKR